MNTTVERTFGLSSVALGVASFVQGFLTQDSVSKAFQQSREAGMAVYEQFILEQGKVLTDFYISFGEDVGVLLVAYGLDLMFKRIQFLGAMSLMLRVAVPVVGAIIEVTQGLGNSNEVFSVPDLMLFGAFALLELRNLKTNIQERQIFPD